MTDSQVKTHATRASIVILHGWRKSGTDYSQIKKIFEQKGYSVFAPDLPGFGKEPIGRKVMRIDDYVLFVKTYFKNHHISQAVLIGHSFGGRVAAKFTSENPGLVSHLIVTGAPLIKQPLSFKKMLIMLPAKAGKLVLDKVPVIAKNARKVLYYMLGEWDYYKATPEIKETFKAVIAEDLVGVLPKISVPTLVLWGEKDTFVSTRIGKQISKNVKNATYKEIPDASHKLPYESPSVFAQAVLQFITK